MRSGACPAQQTLSPEAASVLKHSLSLSRRRGHAQVTPLHVAATLLSSRASLLRRACLKSQPHQPSHPLQCRALELCFNVALNRLPASPGPLLHAQPSLSNALIAALKRAQAHQRRGCVENQQQQQPLIGVKVDLEQLILSILDDPSVSRVMREAGFSSTAVKNNLEDSSVSSVFQCYNNTNGGIYSTPSSPPAELTQRELVSPSNFWQTHLLPFSSQEIKNPILISPQVKQIINQNSFKEDIEVVFGVLLRKKRRNVVLVGDTLSMAEGVSREFMTRVEKGDVPEELKSAHLIKFQFSCVPLKLMKREEVEMNVADLKRKVDSYAKSSNGRVIIYTGDLKWSVEEGEGSSNSGGYDAVDHLVAEIGKLLSWYDENEGLRSTTRVWLMGTASYQTYIKCQMKQQPLDVQWCLQAVSVPSGGLGLSLCATSGQDSRIMLSQNPSSVLDKQEELDTLTCCLECKYHYEKETGFKSLNRDTDHGSVQLPYWLQPHSTLDKADSIQLRKKYNNMCQSLHQGRNYFPSNSGWPNKNKFVADSETISFAYPAVNPNQTASLLLKFRRQQSCHIDFSFSNASTKHQSVEPNLDSLKTMDGGKEVKITLALGNSIQIDTPLCEKIAMIQENVPWQSETIPSILEALMDDSESNRFLLIQGNDFVGKRRLALGIAESVFGSSDLLFCMNMRKNTNTSTVNIEMLQKALRDQGKLVVLVEDADYADPEFVKFLEAEIFEASSKAIFILTVNADRGYNEAGDQSMDSVIQMKLTVNKSSLKRKAGLDFPIRTKNQRDSLMEDISSKSLDLNIKADEDEGKLVEENLQTFLIKIKNCFVLNMNSDKDEQAREMFLSKFKRSFQEANESGSISNFDVEEMVLEEILKGSGVYLNKGFEEWLKNVFQTSLRVVDTGEKDTVSVRLCLEGKGENCAEDGFMGTCLSKRIQVSFIG